MENIIYNYNPSADDEITTIADTAPAYLYTIDCDIDASTVGYIQFFDVADVNDITLGTTAPDVVVTIRGNRLVNFEEGVRFERGCHYAVTTAVGNATAISPTAKVLVTYC